VSRVWRILPKTSKQTRLDDPVELRIAMPIVHASAERRAHAVYLTGIDMRKPLRIALIVLGIVAVGLWYKECVVVDSCYDQGGYWDRDRGYCVRSQTDMPGPN
jgi:hypothetical protein